MDPSILGQDEIGAATTAAVFAQSSSYVTCEFQDTRGIDDGLTSIPLVAAWSAFIYNISS